jgi:hypothetical protein
MGVYDRAARYATQADPVTVFRRLRRITRRELAFVEWIDTRSAPRPAERDQTADRVAKLIDPSAADRPWLALVEFQAAHDPDKLDDVLAEAGQLRRNLRQGRSARASTTSCLCSSTCAGAAPSRCWT